MTKREYVISWGIYRIGLILACLYLLQHILIEPRKPPLFNAFVDTILVLGICAGVGYLAGLLLWRFRGRKNSEKARPKQ
jgi:4-hydroxybenzoate polyprenyltransferase